MRCDTVFLVGFVSYGVVPVAAAEREDKATNWNSYEGELPPEHTELLAETNGKRQLFEKGHYRGLGRTELCWSNPKARRLVVDAVLKYAGEHPEIDVLHYCAEA